MAEHWQPKVSKVEPLVRPVAIDPQGVTGPTRGQVQGPFWRQSTHGLYVPIATDSERSEQRIAEQAVRLGSQGAVTGWAALRMHGAAYFDGASDDGLRPVILVSPDRHLRSDDTSTCQLGMLPESERVIRHGIPVTMIERALYDEMVGSDLRGAVVAMDMAALAELTSIKRMRAYAETRRGAFPIVWPALNLATHHSRSPAESRMRLIWELDAGLPRPVCNRPIFSLEGELLGLPDLLDVELGVVGEYDGVDHKAKDRRFRDLGRETTLRKHGLEYFTVVAGDLHQIDGTVERMVAARERARSTEHVRPGAWTITPPSGWVPFASDQDLDERLDFKDFLASVREA
jgi:hypothetical protein